MCPIFRKKFRQDNAGDAFRLIEADSYFEPETYVKKEKDSGSCWILSLITKELVDILTKKAFFFIYIGHQQEGREGHKESGCTGRIACTLDWQQLDRGICLHAPTFVEYLKAL